MTREETGTFLGNGGTRLFYRTWSSPEPKGQLVFIHGLGEHSGRYQNPAAWFTARGYSVYALDLRGHGHSEGRRGDAASWRQLADDIGIFLKIVPPGRRFLIGHSFGGQVVVNYLSEPSKSDGLNGVILSSANLQVALRVPRFKKVAAKILSRTVPILTLGNEVPPKGISHDPAVVRAYEKDPLVFRKVTVRLGGMILDNLEKIMELAGRIRVPALCLHGGADPITAAQGTRDFFEKIPVEDKTLKIYDGYYHELFNEIGKEKVFHDIEAWVERHP